MNICPSCYPLTWKSSTCGEYGEYKAAGSCYTWKSLTYCEYGKNSWQLLYREKPHTWCIQRGLIDGS
ncbi:MAG: hypothetical protein ACK55Z_21640 [bacterium]